ncbi:hypothetical protein CIRMBP1230_00581 [Enterococcus cecorum]|uniref:hypothetical protein n=1 Tax=Enterococcus cecorum TaxID=44008 RepID=UPI0022DAB93F|nr:hypothetical protein [Enterococcus cecorum]CAI3269259.1 hypothetical protein CIRMBP1220_00202 [Enterococcus cecorum]CAI3273470.1 hypothetical protein CIRMBP1216_00310 [Enterococcus cecorum]CAI3291340.1 hypothetical protein CIRMBP1227_00466 [Enterococcus cecorum]CAI3292510.1 hypothetical protein CIRMBP1230_00581 [Enterococcus cecorum]CAI3303595.1 hypothetical protein CIRMBP1254_00575 [Enterococcus cecorum]
MRNEQKYRKTMRLVIIIVAVFSALFVFLIGKSYGYSKAKTLYDNQPKTKVVKKEATKDLTQSEVERFLIAYYTKKDLSENRDRYKPFMTESMYDKTVREEELPINQAYKGYTVNQVFQRANIYIDQTNLKVLVQVKFKNTQRVKKGSDDRAIKDVSNQANLQLTYKYDKSKKKYFVNELMPILLDDKQSVTDKNSYPTELPNRLSTNDENSENVDESSASEAAETSSSDTKQEESSNQVTESKSAESDKTETSTSQEKSTNEENQKSEEPKNKDMQAIIDSSK